MTTNCGSFLFAFTVIASIARITDATSCNALGTLFYEEIGCKAARAGESGCPLAYECIAFSAEDIANKCLFQGRFYAIGETVDVSDTGYNCQFACRCHGNNTIRCGGVYDCMPDMGPQKTCYWRKDNFKYCCWEQVCEPFANNITCKFDGKVYRDGEAIVSPADCKRCLCKAGLATERDCAKINCGTELFDAKKLANYCALVYRADVPCCPVDFICPSDKDVIVPSGVASGDAKCKYGEESLNVGDSFRANSRRTGDIICECQLPPYVTCV